MIRIADGRGGVTAKIGKRLYQDMINCSLVNMYEFSSVPIVSFAPLPLHTSTTQRFSLYIILYCAYCHLHIVLNFIHASLFYVYCLIPLVIKFWSRVKIILKTVLDQSFGVITIRSLHSLAILCTRITICEK